MPTADDFKTVDKAAINTILTQEANRIGSDVHKHILHTSPWIDLIKKSAFPEGMGYQLNTLIYDRSLPTKTETGSDYGVDWGDVATMNTGANVMGPGYGNLDQPLTDAADKVQGANGPTGDQLGSAGDSRSFVNFSKKLRSYKIKRAVIESPRINVDDLRYAAHRSDQLRAVIDNLADASRHTWAERYRDEFDRLSENVVIAGNTTSVASTFNSTATNSGKALTELLGTGSGNLLAGNSGSDGVTVAAGISNALLDKIYFQMIRKGASQGAYGRENGRPVFGLVCSSEASYDIMTQDGFRDDVRYNNALVGELVKPLGVERSFRGFYHLVDDLAPRFAEPGTSGVAGSANGSLVEVKPYKVVAGVTQIDDNYDSAAYEVAYVIHPEVFESQIPQPFGGSNGLTFDPVSYSGEFKWTNILSEAANPDGTIGFFRGILACASKPIKTEFGYAILFKRNTGPAIV
jgi:hypothetical protein